MYQSSSRRRLEKIVLALCFFSPLMTVGLIYWSTFEGVNVLETLRQPALFTLLLFWIWQSSSRQLTDKVKESL
jgi:hypothetical protein